MIIVTVVIFSLVAGGLFGYLSCYLATSKDIDVLQTQVTSLQESFARCHEQKATNAPCL